MDQAEVVSGANRHLRCSGQAALQPDARSMSGVSVVCPGDLRGQLECAFSNIDAVLANAGMKRSNLVRLRFFTTDIDSFLSNYDVYAKWIAEARIRPPQTLLGVQRLVLRELMVEIEADAAD